MEEKHGKESLCLLWEWECLQIKDNDYRNHCTFTLCLIKDLIPVRLKSTIITRRAKEIIHKAERQLLQDIVKGINSTHLDTTVRLDRCNSNLTSLITSTTMEKCTNFINKVRESILTKVRDRQVNKFKRLMGNYKDRDLTTQPLDNSTQLSGQSKSNKWIINLSSTPMS